MEKVGFIGLGIMGKPMASNLLAAGYEVTVRSRGRGRRRAGRTGREGRLGGQAAAAGEIVIDAPDSPDVESVVFGEAGIAEVIESGSLYIDMSTISPAVSRRIAEVLGRHAARRVIVSRLRRRAGGQEGQPLDHVRRRGTGL